MSNHMVKIKMIDIIPKPPKITVNQLDRHKAMDIITLKLQRPFYFKTVHWSAFHSL